VAVENLLQFRDLGVALPDDAAGALLGE